MALFAKGLTNRQTTDSPMLQRLVNARLLAIELSSKTQEANKKHYDQSTKTPPPLEEESLVMKKKKIRVPVGLLEIAGRDLARGVWVHNNHIRAGLCRGRRPTCFSRAGYPECDTVRCDTVVLTVSTVSIFLFSSIGDSNTKLARCHYLSIPIVHVRV